MFPLVSLTNNYHLLLLNEKKKCFAPQEICPILANEIDLRSEVRDVGFVIPIETLTCIHVKAAPSLAVAFNDTMVRSILSGNDATELNLCSSSQSSTAESSTALTMITDRQFFPSQHTFSPFTVPIFNYDGKLTYHI